MLHAWQHNDVARLPNVQALQVHGNKADDPELATCPTLLALFAGADADDAALSEGGLRAWQDLQLGKMAALLRAQPLQVQLAFSTPASLLLALPGALGARKESADWG